MANEIRTLMLLPDTYAVCRLDAAAAVPPWATTGNFLSITRTAEELSVICLQSLVPDGIRCEQDWRCLQLAGPIPFPTLAAAQRFNQGIAAEGLSVNRNAPPEPRDPRTERRR